MNTLHFSSALGAEHVDTVNKVIRGVSVISGGLIARGHDLAVDQVTLEQMQKSAMSRGQTPVKIDHLSGAGSVVGYLNNFRIKGSKLLADLFLLESHPQTAQILEVAQRMPGGVGLSAAFISPDDAEPGKARCQELVSVDICPLPAANPDGLFAAKIGARHVSGVEKVRRVVGAAARGSEVGALGGVLASGLLQKSRLTNRHAGAAPLAGAVVGAVANGALQYRRDKQRSLSARVAATLFQDRAALKRLTGAVGDNVAVPVPGAEQVETVARVAKKPLVRRAALRALKIGAGAGLGYYVGKKAGSKAGALAGAVAGALFSSAEVRGTVRLGLIHANKVISL